MPLYQSHSIFYVVGESSNNGLQPGTYIIPSGTAYQPSSSNDGIPQYTEITCSSNTNNALTPTASLNSYWTLPLISGSDDNHTEVIFRYYSSSLFSVSESNPSIYVTSSNVNATFIDIELENSDSDSNVATKTYNVIIGSYLSMGRASASLHISGADEDQSIRIYSLLRGAVPEATTNTATGFGHTILQSGSLTINDYADNANIELLSSSFSITTEAETEAGKKSIVFRVPSGSFGGTEDRYPYYISSSGAIGVNTKTPSAAFEISGSILVSGPKGNITASGNISASGIVYADTIYAETMSIDGSTTSGTNTGDQNISNLAVTGSDVIFGNITASGNISGSGQIIGLTGSFAQTVITLKSGAEDSPFIITIADSNGQDNKLEVNKDGVLKMGALDDLPTAVTGGLVYSASAFYMGL